MEAGNQRIGKVSAAKLMLCLPEHVTHLLRVKCTSFTIAEPICQVMEPSSPDFKQLGTMKYIAK